MIKQIRNDYGKFYQKSSRRLLDVSERLEHYYSYLFTSIIKIDLNIDWYDLLKTQIEYQQEQPMWMSNDRSIQKDLLKSDEYFLSTNDSDDFSFNNQFNTDLLEKNYLQRVASDPAMFKVDKINSSYDSISMQTSTMSLPNRSYSFVEIPTTNSYLYQRSLPHIKTNPPQITSVNRRPIIPPKLRTIHSNEQLSSSDSSGSIKKNLIDKSTMTITDKNELINLYATLNKPNIPSRPIISTKNLNDCNNEKYCTESLLKQKMCSSKKYNHTSLPVDHTKFLSLQKPRVYTYDDRNLINQQQNILTSSSGSSTFSFKEKNIKEMGETRYLLLIFIS